MALTYTLYAGGFLSLQEATTVLDSSVLYPRFIQLYASPLNSYSRNSIEGLFGFEPQSVLVFRLDKFAENDQAAYQMIKASLALLNTTIHDALLLFEGEITVLQVRQGALLLNESSSFWSVEGRLQWLDRPYTLASLPNWI